MWERGERRIGEEEEIRKEEINEIIKSLKDGKAMGVDGIPNEVWTYGGRKLRNGNGGM